MVDPARKRKSSRQDWRNRPQTVMRAKRLRREMTDAERLLWSKLRRKQMNGRHFRSQVPVPPYIADFACIELGLIVEVDGGQHNIDQARDARRTAWLESKGYRVLRFWNNEVLQNLDGVLETIRLATLPEPVSPRIDIKP
jgi:very-short-patch-repair endonuclease